MDATPQVIVTAVNKLPFPDPSPCKTGFGRLPWAPLRPRVPRYIMRGLSECGTLRVLPRQARSSTAPERPLPPNGGSAFVTQEGIFPAANRQYQSMTLTVAQLMHP